MVISISLCGLVYLYFMYALHYIYTSKHKQVIYITPNMILSFIYDSIQYIGGSTFRGVLQDLWFTLNGGAFDFMYYPRATL